MFHFDRGLKITSVDLGLDANRRLPRGYISHAHADHLAPHELAFGSPATLRFYQHRCGAHRRIKPWEYRQRHPWHETTLSLWPAGHMLGSTMLLAEEGDRRLLYTGDFRLRRSLTSEPAEPQPADTLIMECTFGSPQYCFPERTHTIDQLLERIDRLLAESLQPVVHAYVLGKAQELSAILSQAGKRVIQHPLVAEYSDLYRQLGCDIGNYDLFENAAACAGGVIIAPPRDQSCQKLEIARAARIGVTGWSLDVHARRRYDVDYLFPLSDHADFNELLECVERVQPREVICVHGSPKFVDELSSRGWKAKWLG